MSVVRFPGQKGSPDACLDQAKEMGLTEVLVAGYRDDDFFLSLSAMSIRDIVTLHRQLGLIIDGEIMAAGG